MSSRVLPLLRALVVVLVIGILVVGAALVKQLLAGSSGAPRTELERAVFAAEEAVRANPNDADARIKLAAAYLEQGSAASAIKQAQDAIRLAPKNATAYYILGLAQQKTGDNASAIQTLKKAAATKGEEAAFYQDAYVALAHAQEKSGDIKGAKASLDKALDNGAENALLLLERAQFGERQKDWYAASLDYAWALEFVPDNKDGRDGLARMRKEHPKESKQALDTINSDIQYNHSAGSTAATGSK